MYKKKKINTFFIAASMSYEERLFNKLTNILFCSKLLVFQVSIINTELIIQNWVFMESLEVKTICYYNIYYY